MMRAAIFIHGHEEGPAQLKAILADEGFEITDIFTPEFDFEGFDHNIYDLLVVMGGVMGVYEADKYPYLLKEIEILQDRLEKDLPTFGICLGSQLIASALGARVYLAEQAMEIGWHKLSITDAGKNTAVQYLDDEPISMFHWHRDTFDLPDGATLLASSDNFKNQAFSYKTKIMALQCHPEVQDWQIPIWSVNESQEDKEKIEKDTMKYLPCLQDHFKTFMQEWLTEIGLK